MSSRAVFIDRDGTLIEHYDYLTDPNQVQLLPRSASALRLLKEHDFLLVVISNQSAVARGMLTEKKLTEIHDYLRSLLAAQGAFLDKIYYCPYHPEATVEKYRRDSDLRKPKPGMLFLAAQELGIDLSQSWMVGDDDRDIEAGQAAGCRSIMLESRTSSRFVHKGQSKPDFHAVNLQEAANLIVRYADTHSRSPEEKIEGHNHSNLLDHQAESQTVLPPDQPKEKMNNPPTPESPVAGLAPPPEELDHPPNEFAAEQAKKAKPNGNVLLQQILRELKTMNRQKNLPAEFSVGRLIAGIAQMLVILCLILAFWLGTGPEPKTDSAQNCLLLALVFQTLTLTLLITHRQQ